MVEPTQPALASALRRLLRPLVRLLLRNGVSYQDFAEHAKKVYVDVASEDFEVAGRKPSISRTAILTGLTRKEVSRLSKPEDGAGGASSERYNRAARVIGGWVRDTRFADPDGEPAVLAIEAADGGPSFSALVRLHGGDVPMRAVLDELIRVGAVERDGSDRIRLLRRAYVPAQDADEMLAILGADTAELISTIDHNITHPPGESFFQRKVSYDNLAGDFVVQLRKRVASRAQALLEELDREMAPFDRDENPDVDGAERRLASIGIYYFEADPSAEDDSAEESAASDESSDDPEGK